ncbi:hypothetical protein LCGC14_1026940 [marine sediment metagenome]|uniref:Uncharacterized protein n=1 Tax=marine sediment metagenome TaxID=412755 RepID=A0A0F9NHJ9_9ZZZZ
MSGIDSYFLAIIAGLMIGNFVIVPLMNLFIVFPESIEGDSFEEDYWECTEWDTKIGIGSVIQFDNNTWCVIQEDSYCYWGEPVFMYRAKIEDINFAFQTKCIEKRFLSKPQSDNGGKT